MTSPAWNALIPLLAGLGLKKRAGAIFTIELSPGILGWLGLNKASEHYAPGHFEINPVVGIRFQEVERVVAECRREKFHPYLPATLSSPIGYVMPAAKYACWKFAPTDFEPVAIDMTKAVEEYGLAFMSSVPDLPGLRQKLEGNRWGHDHQLVYRRPVAAMLDGKNEQAASTLDREEAAMTTRSDLAAIEFRNFAQVLRARLAD